MTRRVHVVPHTHWDREWYLPFQSFRLRLVDVLDDLLPRMQRDPSYARFLLDGQLAVVDDYLAVRPEAAETLRDLVGCGRIAVGPWYTLPDEFLVSGETLIRDLQHGLRTAARYGGAMTVGYLPDMFGHVAQMPQILRQFGLDQAVVWRGVPNAVDRTGFWWEAPDGSTVRAEYLPQGYGNGADLPDDAKALVRQVAEFDQLWSGALADGPILWMNGTDHQAPQSWLGRVVAEADTIQDDYEIVVASLPEHLALASVEGLPTWQGELRSGARANLLMGVTSNRVDVRQAAARAERALEQLAEPLAALYLPDTGWPAALLDEAWLGVVRNAAHDSVCACSVDEVVDAVLHRYAEATQIADGLTERALRQLGAQIAHDGPVVVNPSARHRDGLVELTLPGEAAPPGTQLLRSRRAERILLEGPVDLVVPAAEEVGWDRSIDSFALEADDGTVLVTGDRDRDRGALITPGVRAALAAVDHPGPVRLRVRRQPMVTVLAHVAEVPGFGWSGWTPDAAAVDAARPPTTTGPPDVSVGTGPPDASVGTATAPPASVEAGTTVLDNGLVCIEVDPGDGTFSLNGQAGLGRLVDGGDCGDTYNWCPPADDRLVDTPESVEVVATETGPLRGRLQVSARYRWPERCDRAGFGPRAGAAPGSASAGQWARVGEVVHTVVTTLELRAGEGFVRVEVRVDNRSRDHRLRAHFRLPHPATASRAECAFAVVERGLDAEGGPTEAPLATYPARRFVQAGDLTVVHEGVAEYELLAEPGPDEPASTEVTVAGPAPADPGPSRPAPAELGREDRAGPPTAGAGAASELALTVLRASGMLSQGPMFTRPLPAGPLIPLEGSQLQKPITFRYALATGEVDPFAMADTVLVPLLVADGTTTGRLPASGTQLTIAGAEVSAVRREGGGLRVRVFNPGPAPTIVTVAGRQGWLVDLRGRPLEPFDERFELRAWGIATLAI
ncbi:MAG: hypothetical protein ACRD2C_01655 [Acidimicrobiales bacterium]